MKTGMKKIGNRWTKWWEKSTGLKGDENRRGEGAGVGGEARR